MIRVHSRLKYLKLSSYFYDFISILKYPPNFNHDDLATLLFENLKSTIRSYLEPSENLNHKIKLQTYHFL